MLQKLARMAEKNTEFDVVIIGGSYAGLSAAMTLGRALLKVLVIDAGKPCNRFAPQAHNLLGFDGETPSYIFFVEGLSYGSAVFKNYMRTNTDNSQFYRVAATNTGQPVQQEKHRIWLNITNTQGAFNQMLVGYVDGATVGYDTKFDGKILGGNYVSLYSVIPNNKLTIQGRPLPFQSNDLVDIGYRSTIQGTMQISIANFDGLFLYQNIYLEDKLLNVIHDLKLSSYNFTTQIGTFEARFVLRFDNATSPVKSLTINNIQLKTAAEIAIASTIENLIEVQVYSIDGKMLFQSQGLHAKEFFITDLEKKQQLLLVKITTEDQTTTTKKIIY
jgi:hypothetical protein